MSRARTAIRGRLGRTVVAAVAALVLPVLPASCPCAAARIGSVVPTAGGGCHEHSPAPRPSLPDRGRDCAHCQVAVASTTGQQALSPTRATSRPIAVGQVSSAAGVQTGHAAPPRRAWRPPARTILLEKRVLLL